METEHKIATGFIRWSLQQLGLVAWTSAWNTIYYISEEAMSSKCLRVHEMTHIAQMEREGKLKYMIKYTWYLLVTTGYRRNPYEIEAYTNQHECERNR